MKRDKIIQEARDRFDQAKEAWSPIYERIREDLRFSDPTNPRQWPDEVIRERQSADGGARPCLTFDQTGQFVRQVVNQARRNKPAIKYLPVDDESDPKLAEVLQGLARQTEYQSRADVAYIHSLDNATRGGLGFFRLVLEEMPDHTVKGQLCAKIKKVPDFESVLPDPEFTEPDGSDMGWCFVEEVIPRVKFRKMFKGAKEIDFDNGDAWWGKDSVRIVEYYRVTESNRISVDGADYSEDDYWDAVKAEKVDSKKTPQTKRRRIVEHYKLSGEEVLEQSVFPAEYVPVFPVIGNETWEEGKRMLGGAIRTAKDAQITYNFERNAAYEAVALGPKAPWLASLEAIEGLDAFWKQANRGNLAYLPWNSLDENGNPIQKPERVSPAGIAVGWAQLSEASKLDIQAAMGAYQASVGNNPNQQSGRAVLAIQDKADISTFHYVDNLALSISHCGRVLTQIWPVIYDQEQVVRILGEDDEPDFVRVDPNMPQGYTEIQGQNGQKTIIVNPGVGRYDVRATVGPAFTTRQQEAAAELGELVNGNPQMMALLGDMFVKLRNYPDADKISRRLKAMLPPQVQQAENDENQQIPPQVMAVLQQAQQRLQMLEQENQQLKAGAMQAQQKAMIDAQSKERVAQINAAAGYDQAELKGLVDLLKAAIQPPPQLSAAVSQDVATK